MRTFRAFAFVVAAGIAAGGLFGAQAAHAGSTLPVVIEGLANCEPSGQWQVTYWLRNLAPADVTVLSTTDVVSGASVAMERTFFGYNKDVGERLAVQTAPASATKMGVTVSLKRSDRATAETITKVYPLPAGCAPLPTPSDCVLPSAARYKHTFNGATGVATIELTSKPLCIGWDQEFRLMVLPGDAGAYDESAIFFGPQHRKVTFAVKVPACQAQVVIFAHNDDGSGGPHNDNILGAPGVPGNRSAGPLGTYQKTTGPVCARTATHTVRVSCAGIVTVTAANSATSTMPAMVQFGEFYYEQGYQTGSLLRTVSLLPGESARFVFTDLPNLRRYGGQISVYINGRIVYWSYYRSKVCKPGVSLPRR